MAKPYKVIFLSAAVGALGTAIIGIVFSSTTLDWLKGLLKPPPIPRAAVLFVTGECSLLGPDWKTLELAQGRFLVVAGDSPDGGPRYQSGAIGVGRSKIKLEQDNLPVVNLTLQYTLTNINIGSSGYDMPRAIGTGPSTAAVPLGGKGREIDTLPSWFALRACHQP